MGKIAGFDSWSGSCFPRICQNEASWCGDRSGSYPPFPSIAHEISETPARQRVISMNKEVCRRPDISEYHEYFANYIACVPDGDLFEQLDAQVDEVQNSLKNVSDEEASRLHPPYTWTVKQVVGHLIDAEKLFGWRAHRFGCGDETPLPGMDQDPYVDAIDYTQITLMQLVNELEFTRRSNTSFLRRLPADAWDRKGTASGNSISVRALAWILVGHINHHMEIVKNRLA